MNKDRVVVLQKPEQAKYLRRVCAPLGSHDDLPLELS